MFDSELSRHEPTLRPAGQEVKRKLGLSHCLNPFLVPQSAAGQFRLDGFRSDSLSFMRNGMFIVRFGLYSPFRSQAGRALRA